MNAPTSETTLPLWPADAVPGETGPLEHPEHDTSSPDGRLVENRSVIRLGYVTQPTLTVYPAPAETATGTAVLVCPGGGYNILAWDLEGIEVCEFLNRIGATAFLLKYRVPSRPGGPRADAPLRDARRAMELIRGNAAEWGIDAARVGVLGFSAGGHLAAALASVEAAEVRPNFTVLIYPARLNDGPGSLGLAPDLNVTPETPPAFLAQTEDDGLLLESSLAYYHALYRAKVPAEMHLYPTGGHGYGLRPSEYPLPTLWPRLLTDWMRRSGFLGH